MISPTNGKGDPGAPSDVDCSQFSYDKWVIENKAKVEEASTLKARPGEGYKVDE